ncbi:hybrid sensor histidine kinase/response regulator transcription factor [Lacibacter sp.]|uniref:hybrid sensor histidine kinase/response regulator transcription factor n=1 Tax=Lacibacter sp. TaxID=1915409 RepID=UPI002B4AC4A3|nr:two-component regulator propeller domain-containing protein [Lacibacter sp.]HLP37673.1 two-component regulator propeller domain-containing protein [Lacibacter sp.]
MKRLLLICCILALVALGAFKSSAQQVNYRFRHLTVDNGLSHTDATSIVQDDNGFVWIGTYSGLNRFDGYSTKVYYNNVVNRAAYLNRIADIALCKNNYLWLATEGGLAVFKTSTLSYQKLLATDDETAVALLQPLQKIAVAGNRLFAVNQNTVQLFNTSGEFSITKLKTQYTITGTFLGMRTDEKENLWVNHTNGLLVILKNGDSKSISFTDPGANTITATYINAKGELFICNSRGVYVFNVQKQNSLLTTKTSRIAVQTSELIPLTSFPSAFPLPNNMRQDKRGDFWFSTAGGLWQYNTRIAAFYPYRFNEFERTSISSNSVNSVFIDRSECLWLTTFGGGVNLTDLQQKPFQLLQRIPNSSNTLSGNYIRAILEDEKGNIWIGTRNNGLNYYDFNTKKNQQYHPTNSGLQSDNIRSLVKDHQNRMWIGTESGISIRYPDGSFDNLKGAINTPGSFVSGNYFALAVDKFGQVWGGTWNAGLSRIDYKGKNNYTVEHITTASKKGLLSDRVTFIYTDDQRPEVLVGTDHGLNHIFLHSDGTIASIKNYHASNGNQLSSEFVWPVLRQGDSVIWTGTLGGGLNKIRLQKDGSYIITTINDNSTQAIRDIEGMLMDEQGNLWLAGKLLAMYNPAKNSFIYYDVNDGLQGNSFKIGAAHKGASGRMYFGGINGLSFFYPSAIANNQREPSVSFTELLINGEVVQPGHEAFREAVSSSQKLIFEASQNNFSIQFSAMHYANPERCKYRYQLKGYDRNWIYTDASNRFATYSNLDYGNYTLRVEAANSDGVWTGKGKELSIKLLAPWWKTTLAKIAYIILLGFIIYIIWSYQHSWFDLKRKLQFRELEEKKQEEMHQMKLQFFTNISHEFRTPLTLILGPTEKMLHNETSKEEQFNFLRLIYSNTRRLLGLTNELMDFRKVETDNMKLRVVKGDLGNFVKSISTEFRELASEKNITFSIKTPEVNTGLYFDPNIMEKVLVNLIANAFKYTDSNGTVEVEVLQSIHEFKPKYKNHVVIPSSVSEQEMAWIRVTDSGIGITANSIENIFDRYFRVNTTGREKHLGSGVGLALVKSLIELHKGALHVYSQRNEGTEFLVGIALNTKPYTSLEISDDEDFQIDFENLQYTIDWIEADSQNNTKLTRPVKDKKNDTQIKRVLIVEDNSEMRRFLSDSLGNDYEVLEAGDGAEGLKKAKEFFPDLIISDLMMPEMDGNELCAAVRSDIDISHIPFILITAKSSVDTHLEGLESGADIYFPKPFSLRLLQVTIRNLFEQRDKLKAKYNQDVFAEARELVNSDRDKEFLDELIGIIESNMEDEELDVDMICRKIGMSRTKLYGKVKGVTGQPIGEFIRLLRLKRAAKILVSEDISVQEVMFKVGIQSQSYFTKSFKKEFGKTPSQFVAEFSQKPPKAFFDTENDS